MVSTNAHEVVRTRLLPVDIVFANLPNIDVKYRDKIEVQQIHKWGGFNRAVFDKIKIMYFELPLTII